MSVKGGSLQVVNYNGSVVYNWQFKALPSEGVISLNEVGFNKLNELLSNRYEGIVELDSRHIHDNKDIQLNSRSTYYANGVKKPIFNAKILINLTAFDKKFSFSRTVATGAYAYTGYDSSYKGYAIGIPFTTDMVNQDNNNIILNFHAGCVARNPYKGSSTGVTSTCNGVSCPTLMPIKGEIDDNTAFLHYPLTFDNDTVKYTEKYGGVYGLLHKNTIWGVEYTTDEVHFIMLITKVDMQEKRLYYKTINEPNYSVSAIKSGSSGSYVKYRCSFECLDNVLTPAEVIGIKDTWLVEDIPYDISETSSNGKGNLLLSSSDSPAVVGFGKSEFTFMDSNGVSKILTPDELNLNVNVSRSVDDMYTSVVINGMTTQFRSKEFTLLIMHNVDGESVIKKITSPLPGNSNGFTLNIQPTSATPPINFDSYLHNALTSAIRNPGIVTNYNVDLNVRNGKITMEGGFVCGVHKTIDKKYLTIHMLNVNVHYYPNDNSKTTSIMNQAFTIKVECESINDKLLINTGISSVDYSLSTTQGLPYSYDGVSVILPTTFNPYLRNVQLDSENMVVNGSTIGFTVNVDKLVNRQILDVTNTHSDRYFGKH